LYFKPTYVVAVSVTTVTMPKLLTSPQLVSKSKRNSIDLYVAVDRLERFVSEMTFFAYR